MICCRRGRKEALCSGSASGSDSLPGNPWRQTPATAFGSCSDGDDVSPVRIAVAARPRSQRQQTELKPAAESSAAGLPVAGDGRAESQIDGKWSRSSSCDQQPEKHKQIADKARDGAHHHPSESPRKREEDVGPTRGQSCSVSAAAVEQPLPPALESVSPGHRLPPSWGSRASGGGKRAHSSSRSPSRRNNINGRRSKSTQHLNGVLRRSVPTFGTDSENVPLAASWTAVAATFHSRTVIVNFSDTAVVQELRGFVQAGVALSGPSFSSNCIQIRSSVPPFCSERSAPPQAL